METKDENLYKILLPIIDRLDGIEKILKEIKADKRDGQPDFITIDEASSILKLAVPTLYSKVCRMEIPVYKRGNRLYFSKKELLSFIKSGRRKNSSEIDDQASKFIPRKG